MKKSLLIYTLLFIIGFSNNGYSQTSDFELWLKAGTKLQFGDRWGLSIEEQIRFDENAGALKNYHTEAEIKFEVAKFLDLILATRYITRNDNKGEKQGFEDHFRYQLGVGLKHKAGKFNIKHRLLYQNRNEVDLSQSEGDVHRTFFRWRSGFTYKIKNWKYDPQFNIEYFNAFDKAAAGTDNSIRFTIGTEREHKKIGEFGIFYRYENTLGTIIDEITHVLALKYTYKF